MSAWGCAGGWTVRAMFSCETSIRWRSASSQIRGWKYRSIFARVRLVGEGGGMAGRREAGREVRGQEGGSGRGRGAGRRGDAVRGGGGKGE